MQNLDEESGVVGGCRIQTAGSTVSRNRRARRSPGGLIVLERLSVRIMTYRQMGYHLRRPDETAGCHPERNQQTFFHIVIERWNGCAERDIVLESAAVVGVRL